MFGKLQDALLAKDDEEDERLAAMEAAIAEREREVAEAERAMGRLKRKFEPFIASFRKAKRRQPTKSDYQKAKLGAEYDEYARLRELLSRAPGP